MAKTKTVEIGGRSFTIKKIGPVTLSRIQATNDNEISFELAKACVVEPKLWIPEDGAECPEGHYNIDEFDMVEWADLSLAVQEHSGLKEANEKLAPLSGTPSTT